VTVPAAFYERLRQWEGADAFEDADGLGSPETLAEVGRRALVRSIEPEGRERRGAFDLLAADAFLTRAAERALEEDDPGPVLLRMASSIADAGRDTPGSGKGPPGAPDASPAD